MKICTRCRKSEARPGFKSCEACAARAAHNMQRVRVKGGEGRKAKQKEWKRASFERRRPVLLAAGICLHCQCKQAAPGLKTCRPCLDATARRSA